MDPGDRSMPQASGVILSDNRVLRGPSGTPIARNSLSTRSCVTCSRRKVKCDKKSPCYHCQKANVDCIFPPPGRAPRRARKSPEANLHERLRRLESFIKDLGIPVQQDGTISASDVKKAPEYGQLLQESTREGGEEEEGNSLQKDINSVSNRFGRLIVTEDSSRYVSPGLWTHLNAEISDLKDILERASDDESDEQPSETWDASSDQAFIFGLSSSNVKMSSLHPPAETARAYWEIFKENVDPLMKVLHIPTQEPQILDNMTHLHDLSRPAECIMFAIYYSAVSSLFPDQCKHRFGSRDSLLARYKFGIQQALARAKFLQSNSVFVLQSLIIFLIVLRANEEGIGMLAVLGSIAIRIAQRLGLHQDGSHYANLTPFKQEIRRRLWWHTVMLDSRVGEDHSFDPRIYDMMADTKFPRNLNDSDLTVDMKELPESRVGCTEMTFSLVLLEITTVLRKIDFVPAASNATTIEKYRPADKRKLVEDLNSRLEEKYFKNVDLSIPLHWLSVNMARSILSKAVLMQRIDGNEKNISSSLRDELMENAIETIEFTASYFSDGKASKYSWLIAQHGNWLDVMALLGELCARPLGPNADRAWRAIKISTGSKKNQISKDDVHLWKPLQRLMAKAEAEREKALSEQQKRVTTDMNTIQQHNPIHPQQDHIMNIDFGTERLYSAQTNPVFMTKSHVPSAAKDMDVWNSSESPIHPLQNPPYAGPLHFGLPPGVHQPIGTVHIADTSQYSGLPEIGNGWANPYTSMANINHGVASDPLDWAMQDDMTQEPILDPDMQANSRLNNGYPPLLGGWSNWP